MIYFIIFISKILENTLSTLKIVLTANDKKVIGAILTFAISIIWVLSVAFIVVDFNDYLKIFSFAIGSGIGSYLGNTIEEKMALGCIIIEFFINKDDYYRLKKILANYNIKIIKINNIYKAELNVKRKEQKKIIKIIKRQNKNIKINVIKVFNC